MDSGAFDDAVNDAPQADHAQDVHEVEPLLNGVALHTNPQPTLDSSTPREQTIRFPAKISAGPVENGHPHMLNSRFHVLKRIGEGGFGEILLAHDRDLDRLVAVKRLRSDRANNPNRQRLVDEAVVVGRLEHPNLVSIYELGLDDRDEVFYAMELVNGETLKVIADQFHQQKTKAWQSRGFLNLLRIFREACNGVAAAHDVDVIHRDLKPANIMVGPRDRAKVIDWGLNQILDGQTSGPRSVPDRLRANDRSKDQAGTLIYMAPEQLKQGGEISKQTDVYGLGTILYYILCGRTPHDPPLTGHADVATWNALARRVQSADWIPLKQRDKGIPRPLRKICERAIAENPTDRYQTVSDLADDIDRYSANEPVLADHREPPQDSFRRILRRHTERVAAIAVVILVLLVGTGLNVITDQERQRQFLETELETVALKSLAGYQKKYIDLIESLLETEIESGKPEMSYIDFLVPRVRTQKGLLALHSIVKFVNRGLATLPMISYTIPKKDSFDISCVVLYRSLLVTQRLSNYGEHDGALTIQQRAYHFAEQELPNLAEPDDPRLGFYRGITAFGLGRVYARQALSWEANPTDRLEAERLLTEAIGQLRKPNDLVKPIDRGETSDRDEPVVSFEEWEYFLRSMDELSRIHALDPSTWQKSTEESDFFIMRVLSIIETVSSPEFLKENIEIVSNSRGERADELLIRRLVRDRSERLSYFLLDHLLNRMGHLRSRIRSGIATAEEPEILRNLTDLASSEVDRFSGIAPRTNEALYLEALFVFNQLDTSLLLPNQLPDFEERRQHGLALIGELNLREPEDQRFQELADQLDRIGKDKYISEPQPLQ